MAKTKIGCDTVMAATIAVWYNIFKDELYYEICPNWFPGSVRLIFYKIENGKIDGHCSIMDVAIPYEEYKEFFPDAYRIEDYQVEES